MIIGSIACPGRMLSLARMLEKLMTLAGILEGLGTASTLLLPGVEFGSLADSGGIDITSMFLSV